MLNIEKPSVEELLSTNSITIEQRTRTDGQETLPTDESTENRQEVYIGDNLYGLTHLIETDIDVDLVYMDPPFATGREFNMGDEDTEVKQFSNKGETAYSDTRDLQDYLEHIYQRLQLIHEVLSDKGTIYVHIDNNRGPYLKVLLDEVFGIDNYMNTITRVKCNPKNFSRDAYGNMTDIILVYSKTNDHIWNDPHQDYTDDQLERLFRKEDEDGRRFTTTPLHAPGETENGATGEPWNGREPPEGRHWRHPPEELTRLDENDMIYWSSNGNPRKKRYADEAAGPKRQDLWDSFKDPQSKEYPTQKNLDLLKTIIEASSNEDSLVLDPYMGGGTTLLASEELNRNFIGMDMSDEAVSVTQDRLQKPVNVFSITEDSE